MTTRTRSLLIVVGLLGFSLALFWNLAGCSNDKKQITPPVVGPAAGSGPVGGGDTQKIQLSANPSSPQITVEEEQATVTITALIENNIGQPMPDGTAVYWSTTEGSLNPTVGTSSNGSATATLTFPPAFDGCSIVTATSGDVSARIKLCVNNIDATPTPGPTATPTAAPTATPVPTAVPVPTATPITRTLEILSPTPPTYTHDCVLDGDLTITVLAANGGVPENGTLVTFTVYGTGLTLVPPTSIPTDVAGLASYTFASPGPPNQCTGGGLITTVVVSTTYGRTASIVITTN